MLRQDRPDPRGVKFGLFGGRSDHRGLSTQTVEIARNLQPDRVLGLDMGDLSPLPCDWTQYDPATLTVRRLDQLTEADAAEWLDGLDAILGCETFYRPWVTGLARRLGVGTVLQANPEFVGHVAQWPPEPDVLAVPTRWRIDQIPGAEVLPVGIAVDRLARRPRTSLQVVLHVVGTGAAADRNGTRVLLEALRSVRRPLGVVVRSQHPLDLSGWAARLPPCVDLEVRCGDEPDYWRLYDDADLLVLPRRYGGLCLPAGEALGSGMPVLMPDCPPNGDLLPPSMLVPLDPPGPDRRFQTQSGVVRLHDADPAALARRLNDLCAEPAEMAALSAEAMAVADRLSWPNVAPFYHDALGRAAERCRARSRLAR